MRERMLDAPWLLFFVGAIGLDPRFPVALAMLVWFPADLMVLIVLWLLPGGASRNFYMSNGSRSQFSASS
jgi:hypothetical protein